MKEEKIIRMELKSAKQKISNHTHICIHTQFNIYSCTFFTHTYNISYPKKYRQ